jgi:hypothetical protein
MACLIYLALKEFDLPCDNRASMEKRVGKYKFALYAAQFWAFHIRQVEIDLDVQEAVFAVFVLKSRWDSILQLETYACSGRASVDYVNN